MSWHMAGSQQMKKLYVPLLSSTDLDNEKCLLLRGWEDSIQWQVEESRWTTDYDQISSGEASSPRVDPLLTVLCPSLAASYHNTQSTGQWVIWGWGWEEVSLGYRNRHLILAAVVPDVAGFPAHWPAGHSGGLVVWVREECGAGCLGVSLCEEKPVPHACQFSNGISRGRA